MCTSNPSDRPSPNSYWVVPGRFAAGEYPGAWNSAEAEARLKSLLEAGVDHFIDLTQAGELVPYFQIAEHTARQIGRSMSSGNVTPSSTRALRAPLNKWQRPSTPSTMHWMTARPFMFTVGAESGAPGRWLAAGWCGTGTRETKPFAKSPTGGKTWKRSAGIPVRLRPDNNTRMSATGWNHRIGRRTND